MHAFEARKVEPLKSYWGDATLYTLPPTSGGLTVLQILNTLQALHWPRGIEPNQREIALVEAMRLAWHDRLTKLGDPQFGYIPKQTMLNQQNGGSSCPASSPKPHARPTARCPKRWSHRWRHDSSLNAVGQSRPERSLDLHAWRRLRRASYCRWTRPVDGHGLSRFDPVPGRANSPASGKRPLHNKCPTLVMRDGKVEVTIGATGGRRIVNAVTNVLAPYLSGTLTIERSCQGAATAYRRWLGLGSRTRLCSRRPVTRFGFVVNRGAIATDSDSQEQRGARSRHSEASGSGTIGFTGCLCSSIGSWAA